MLRENKEKKRKEGGNKTIKKKRNLKKLFIKRNQALWQLGINQQRKMKKKEGKGKRKQRNKKREKKKQK